MRIGFFHSRAGWRHAGGKAIFVRKLASALASDHEVTLYTQYDPNSDVASRLESSGVRLVDLPNSIPASAEVVVDRALPLARDPLVPLTRALTDGIVADIDERTDLLVTHRFLEDLVLSNLVDVPVAYQYHNVRQVGPGAQLRERLSASSIHLANSDAIATEVREKLGRDVDGIVSPGVDTDHFSPTAAEPVTAGEPTVLFVGRVVPAKGVLDLLDAVAALPETPSVRIVGDGEIDTARRRTSRLGIRDSVDFLGEVDHESLPAVYASADVFCNPTHYEGFGMVNVEAMACETAVVTTRLPGIEGYASDGENAVLVEPSTPGALAQALESLLSAPDRRARLARAGRETALQYDWHVQADRLVEICRPATAQSVETR